MGPKKPPPAGSDSGLWPPQGQSRFFEPINPFSNSSLIQIQRIEFFLSTKLFSAKVIHSGGKVGFRFPTIPFLYPEYKIRNISIFYSLEFYFSQRAGEGRKSLHRPGLTPAYGLRRAKVVFSAPSIPFCIYHLYKFRELSSFYLLNL